MTAVTICAIVVAIISLILIQKINLRFVLSEDSTATIDYSFFTLTFRKKANTSKKHGTKKHRPPIQALIRASLHVIKTSHITVNRVNIPLGTDDPFKFSIRRAGVNSGIYSILNLITSFAKSTVFSDGAITTPSYYRDEYSPALDIALETGLYNFCFSGIILVYEVLKRRIKELNV